MGKVVFLAVLGALTIYAGEVLFGAPGWGAIVAVALFVIGMNASDRPVAINPARTRSLPVQNRGVDQSFLRFPDRSLFGVITLSLLLGCALGWLIRGLQDDQPAQLLKFQRRDLLAMASLKAALESIPSRRRAPLEVGTDAEFLAKMSFRSQAGTYCRRYELALGREQGVAGIACRASGGNWTVTLQATLAPSASNITRPASTEPTAALDAATAALIDGDPLVGAAEEQIMRSRWHD